MKGALALIAIAGIANLSLAGHGLAQTAKPPEHRTVTSPQPGQPSHASRHTMDGEVTKVDAKKGWVDVKTPEGRMKLHYPPSALDGVKSGDRVTVELGLSRGTR